MISIILPTYNESENIPILVERIDDILEGIQCRYEIIVVDDDSPDRTWETASDLAEYYPLEVVRRRRETGLATAVVRGIEAASGDILCVMDADLQHPPERIPAMLDELAETQSRLIVGSRLAESGSFGEFSPIRRLETWVANRLAKLLFPETWGIGDIQSGFFLCRRQTIEDVDFDPRGYKILIEILVLGEYDSVREVGYEFRERHRGDSNLDIHTVIDYLRHLVSLRYRSLRSN